MHWIRRHALCRMRWTSTWCASTGSSRAGRIRRSSSPGWINAAIPSFARGAKNEARGCDLIGGDVASQVDAVLRAGGDRRQWGAEKAGGARYRDRGKAGERRDGRSVWVAGGRAGYARAGDRRQAECGRFHAKKERAAHETARAA